MKKLFGLPIKIAILVSLVSLTALGLPGYAAYAARQPHGPEMLRIDGLQWDKASQQFRLDVSCQSGIAHGGEKAFSLSIELWVDRDIPDNETIFIYQDVPVFRSEGALKDAERMIQLVPQYIPWDRVGGIYKGQVFVTAKVVLENRHGGSIGQQVERFFTLGYVD